jgi:hypothetical protein
MGHIRQGHARRTAVVAMVVLLVAACGGTGTDASTRATGERGWLDGGGDWDGDAVAAGGDTRLEHAADADASAPADPAVELSAGAGSEVPAPSTTPGDDDGGGGEGGDGSFDVPDEVGLSAGSIDDNERWDAYLRYREAFLATGTPVSDRDVTGRHLVRAVDGSGRPVLGALVELRDPDGTAVDRARTLADGRAVLFAPPLGTTGANQVEERYLAAVEHRGDTVEVELTGDPGVQDISLEGDRRVDRTRLDLHLLIDATGSMDDEINRLKSHMTSVAERVAGLDGAPEVRFSLTAYRDEGDAFVTRTFDFTADVAAFATAVDDVEADGGGDDPEALNEGLAEALAGPAWSEGEVVRLIALVADAPPQLDREPGYLTSVDVARERGVKILPIASSGTNDQAEYVFRQLAQQTLGRFTFLTYGADGASPGDSTPHHVDDYSVLSLDDLVVQLIADELAHL